MAKVILMCGKICSGKSTYAERIRKEKRGVLLSVDEIMLAMFNQDVGEKHDDYVASLEKYLYAKSIEMIEVGIDVIIDTGLWTKAERIEAREFYSSRKIACEIHYLDISEEEWHKRIEKRNREVSENKVSAYFVDKGLAEKASQLFEKPDRTEVDVWIKGLEWTFDTVAEKYEKMRPSYPHQLYEDIFRVTPVGVSCKAMEIGIGSGQATIPVLKTGCDVLAVEYGKNFTELCLEKFKNYNNFKVVNAKFEDYICESNSFDLIYSATAFHWIDEETGYRKVHELLKSRGIFARFANHPIPDIERKELSEAIQNLYDVYMPRPNKPERYSEKQAEDIAKIALKYGFIDVDCKLYYRTRTFTASEYTELLGTYSDHNILPDSVKKEFWNKIENTINHYGGQITIYDTIDLQIARKP